METPVQKALAKLASSPLDCRLTLGQVLTIQAVLKDARESSKDETWTNMLRAIEDKLADVLSEVSL